MAHDQQLRFGAELVQQIEEPVQVDVVESGLNLVHHVKRRRAAAENGK
jgi:hypothetical protein